MGQAAIGFNKQAINSEVNITNTKIYSSSNDAGFLFYNGSDTNSLSISSSSYNEEKISNFNSKEIGYYDYVDGKLKSL